jgi:hypothetical protein
MVEHVRAGDHEALQLENARCLQHVGRAHDVELDRAERILLRADGEHRVRRHVHHRGNRMLAQHRSEGERLEHVAFHERHPGEIDDAPERSRLRRPVHEHRVLALLHQDAGDLRADQARADNERSHALSYL